MSYSAADPITAARERDGMSDDQQRLTDEDAKLLIKSIEEVEREEATSTDAATETASSTQNESTTASK